jgi:16S rRNA (uracil1498-N3)-methyltransferase
VSRAALVVEAVPALLYLPGLPEPGSRLELGAADAHYVARVCRARVGERVEATDGRGARAAVRVIEVRRGVVVEVEAVTREPARRRSWVLCGAPEGERADWLVEKLAELGIGRLLPVDVVRGHWRTASGRRARWERLAIAALRQSRRLHLMAVEEPVPLREALASLPPGSNRWLTDESGVAAAGRVPTGGDLMIGLVGPSGGLEDGERQAALAAGFQPLRLSDARLRTETAALAWAVWWSGGSA